MAGLFDLLNTVIGKITQNSVTYATAPTPPDGDNSTKVATTEFVKGVAPSGNVAVWSRGFTHTFVVDGNGAIYAPSGGTWFCWGTYIINHYTGSIKFNSNGTVASGNSTLASGKATSSMTSVTNNAMAIKIA